MAHVVRASLFLGLCLQAIPAMAYSVTIKDASVTSTAADGDASTEPLTFPRLLPETLLLTPETDVTVAFQLVDSLTGDAVAPQQVRPPDLPTRIPLRLCLLCRQRTESHASCWPHDCCGVHCLFVWSCAHAPSFNNCVI